MDITNLLIISLLLLEEEDGNEENRRRRERWAAMTAVEKDERTRSLPRISLPKSMSIALEYRISFKKRKSSDHLNGFEP